MRIIDVERDEVDGQDNEDPDQLFSLEQFIEVKSREELFPETAFLVWLQVFGILDHK